MLGLRQEKFRSACIVADIIVELRFEMVEADGSRQSKRSMSIPCHILLMNRQDCSVAWVYRKMI